MSITPFTASLLYLAFATWGWAGGLVFFAMGQHSRNLGRLAILCGPCGWGGYFLMKDCDRDGIHGR